MKYVTQISGVNNQNVVELNTPEKARVYPDMESPGHFMLLIGQTEVDMYFGKNLIESDSGATWNPIVTQFNVQE